jgi:hypothetical protein
MVGKGVESHSNEQRTREITDEVLCRRRYCVPEKVTNTLSQNFFGGASLLTMDPKNIQTILATQFKDFGLGDTRIGNFNPLLGHGIVSHDDG